MAYFHCLIGGGSSGGGYELTVTCDADFAGTTITCTDGVTTLTQTCPSASPYEVVFEIPNGGEWTISGIISGQTYSASIDIPDSLELHSIPEGSTVLPTDDIQTWLACAGITDKAYTTLNEVLADSTTLLALMSDDNAVDYLVRSTTWASGITADSTAMTDIGANNYCANTLLADSTWLTAICNSTYFESVLNTKIPAMTSNTTPSGECSQSSTYGSGYEAFKSVNGLGATAVLSSSDTDTYWQYKFEEPVICNKFIVQEYNNPSSLHVQSFWSQAKIQGSNDGSTFTDIYTINETISQNVIYNVEFPNNTAYQWYRLQITQWGTQATVYKQVGKNLQFYGREDG